MLSTNFDTKYIFLRTGYPILISYISLEGQFFLSQIDF